jgi:hypothetical protein
MRCYSLHSSLIGGFAAACGLLASAGVALAAPETWVSGTGSNTGDCPITAPCRTFRFAHDRTNNNGAINVLSSGNFGPLIITKPGTDNRGIGFASGAALHVQDCVIRRASNGILFLVFSGTSELYVADTVVANSDANGIIVAPSGSGSAKPVFDRVRVENGLGHGFSFSGSGTTGSITATVSDSVAAGHGNTGIFANVGAGTTTVMIDRSASVNNATGIRVRTSIQFPGGAATARIGDSTVSGKGWTQS